MKVRWIGHAAFYFETSEGLRIRTDPYDSSVGLPVSRLEADVVTVSHDHFDHNAVATVPGNPEIVKGPRALTLRGTTFAPTPSFHDDSSGSQRGRNMIYTFTVDGVTVTHLGDLGHIPTTAQVNQIAPTDILCVPVGGVYTIDAAGATETVRLIKPRIALPMHYRIPGLTIGIGALEPFLQGKEDVERRDELDVTPDTLPEPTRIVVLEPRP